MTIINPNSISGITSVTAEAGVMNFYKSDGTLAGLQLNGVNFNTTAGVSTFNNVYVGGTITYEDVKNVDSVGIITARTGIAIPNDSYKLRSGTDLEMQVWHDGTNSVIKDTRNSGKVRIQADNFDIIDKDASETMLSATVDGAVSLNYNGSTKLATTNTGVTVTGAINLTGASSGNYLNVGSSTVYANAAINIIRYGSGYADIRLSSNYGAKIALAGASDNTDEFYVQQGNTKDAYIWNEANKHITFGTNNTARMWLANNGNFRVVGISTFNSNVHVDGALDVDGATTLDGLTVAEASVFNDDIFINVRGKKFKTSDWSIFNTTSGNALAINGGDADTERLRIASDGKIGIGINNPNRLLTLYGDSGIALQNSTTGTGNANGTHIWVNSSGNGELLIQNREASDIEFYTSDAERIRITSDGHVKILGQGQTTGFYLTNSYGQAGIFGGMYFNGSAWVRDAHASRLGAGMYVNTGGHIAFLKAPENSGTSATVTESLRISSSGNLLLGTTTDSQRLHVYNGNGGTGYKTALFNSNDTSNGTRLVVANSGNTSGRGLGIMVGGSYAGTDKASLGWFNTDNTFATASILTLTSTGQAYFKETVGIQTNDVTRANLANPVGAGHSLVGMYIGDGSLLFNNTLNRPGGYYISTETNALNAGPVTLDANMKVDGAWVIV